MKKILVIGEILAEILADSTGNGFLEPQALSGPFPSGAPAIFADQAARMGQPVAIISAVGNDDFGQLNLQRLGQDGVDLSGIYIDPDRPTGSAFVRYKNDGSRNFVFNIRHSASGHIHESAATQQLIDDADHMHVMGSSLSSPAFIELNIRAAKAVKARGGSVSFDPNMRKEMLDAPGMTQAMTQILAITDLFLPSDMELMLFCMAENEQDAIAELLAKGIQAIVHKRGKAGAHYYSADENYTAQAFHVRELDPTGAGDCFGASFTSLWLRNIHPQEALTFATAAGALAVTKRGPMEGASYIQDIETFITSQASK